MSQAELHSNNKCYLAENCYEREEKKAVCDGIKMNAPTMFDLGTRNLHQNEMNKKLWAFFC